MATDWTTDRERTLKRAFLAADKFVSKQSAKRLNSDQKEDLRTRCYETCVRVYEKCVDYERFAPLLQTSLSHALADFYRHDCNDRMGGSAGQYAHAQRIESYENVVFASTGSMPREIDVQMRMGLNDRQWMRHKAYVTNVSKHGVANLDVCMQNEEAASALDDPTGLIHLRQVLSRLPRVQRLAVAMRLEGYTLRETCEACGLTKTQLWRLMRNIALHVREELEYN